MLKKINVMFTLKKQTNVYKTSQGFISIEKIIF